MKLTPFLVLSSFRVSSSENGYAFSCSVILPGQLIRKWLQERSILQPLYFCLCFPALKITPTELFQISETDFSPGCNFQVTWSTKKSYFSIVIASDPAWLTSPFPLSHQTTPCIEGMKGFSASFPAVCTQKGTPLRLILKRSALKVFGTGTYALLYTVICYDVPSGIHFRYCFDDLFWSVIIVFVPVLPETACLSPCFIVYLLPCICCQIVVHRIFCCRELYFPVLPPARINHGI